MTVDQQGLTFSDQTNTAGKDWVKCLEGNFKRKSFDLQKLLRSQLDGTQP